MFSLLGFKQDACDHSSVFANGSMKDLKLLKRPSEGQALDFETESPLTVSPSHPVDCWE